MSVRYRCSDESPRDEVPQPNVFALNRSNIASNAMAKELHSRGVLCTSASRGGMTASDEARRWRSSPQRVSPGTVTTGTHAATPPRNRCVGAAAEGSRPTGDRCTLGTPDDRQAASRVSGAAVHVRTSVGSCPLPPSDGLTYRRRLAGANHDRIRTMTDPERQAVPTAVLVRRQRGLELGPELPVPHLEGHQ